MKCYYQPEDKGDEWLHGTLDSVRGGTLLHFTAKDDDGKVIHHIALYQPECLFHDSGLSVTGWLNVGNETHKLFKVEVRLVKPKVTFCSWCPDPHRPSKEHHPGGQFRHDIHPKEKQ